MSSLEPVPPPPPPPSPCPASPAPTYRDRYAGLVFFGIVQILCGLLALLVVPALFLAARVSERAGQASPGLNSRTMIPAAAIYVGVGAVLMTLGVGSILARRWARALMLVLSAVWLVIGGVAFVIVAALLARTFRRMPATSPGAPEFVMAFAMLVLFFAYIALPLVFFLFYRGRNVKLTCEVRDPTPRWTDSCPVPVLALSVLLAGYALCSPLGMAYRVLPAFGHILTGGPAIAVFFLIGGVAALLAVGAYRLRLWAWWGALALVACGTAYGVITFASLDVVQYYRALGYSEADIQRLDLAALFSSPLLIVGIAVAGLAYAGYILWVRRYFDAARAAAL